VEPTLRALKNRGIKRCVTSNSWPSLNRILAGLNIEKYFNTVVVSSKVGYEKPNREIFEIAMKRLSVKPDRMIHIGNELNDVIGARNAGITPVLIDRKGDKSMDCITIGSLKEILKLL
jgi:putative hydrolase of the HAD superfamily